MKRVREESAHKTSAQVEMQTQSHAGTLRSSVLKAIVKEKHRFPRQPETTHTGKTSYKMGEGSTSPPSPPWVFH